MLNPFGLFLKLEIEVDIYSKLEKKDLGGTLLEREVKRLRFCHYHSV